MQKQKAAIEAAGGTLIAISPQLPERSNEMSQQNELTISLLADQGSAFADSLGLRHQVPDDVRSIYLEFGIDLEKSNGESSWTLPIPARYIIDQQGLVRYARIDADYTRRPEPDETVAALQALQNS